MINQLPAIWKDLHKLENAEKMTGKIVSGFGRGSKDLGFPTANIESESALTIKTGIYAGIAHLEGKTYKAAVSIGLCPFYGNEKISIEVYILETFDEDLRGKFLECDIVYYLRNESNFNTLDELIKAITTDVQLTEDLIKI